MDVTFNQEGNRITGVLAGKLNSNTAPSLEEQLKQYTSPPNAHLVLDFENMDYISSAGLRVVLTVTRAFKPTDWTFATCSLQEHVQEVFEMSGFDNFIDIYPSRDDAYKALG